MKDELTALDVHYLVRELQVFVGGRFDKAYALEHGEELYLQFQIAGQGKQLLRIKLPGLMYLASARPEFPQNPPGFCMFLRKRLANARIEAVEQLGMDRIVVFTLTKKASTTQSSPTLQPRTPDSRQGTSSAPPGPAVAADGVNGCKGTDGDDCVDDGLVRFCLIVELIAPGNIILEGRKPVKGGKLSEPLILNLLRPQNFKDRTLRGGIAYEPPPLSVDLKTADEADLVGGILQSGMDMLVKALAVALSLGGEYATAVCERAGLDTGKEHYTKEDAIVAIKEAKKLLDEQPRPLVTEKGIDMLPEEGPAGTPYETLSEALDAKFTEHDAIVQAETKAKKGKKGSILDQQQAQKAGFEKSSEENQRRGELIYEHYQELTELLKQLKAGEESTVACFKKFDKKTGVVTVELD